MNYIILMDFGAMGAVVIIDGRISCHLCMWVLWAMMVVDGDDSGEGSARFWRGWSGVNWQRVEWDLGFVWTSPRLISVCRSSEIYGIGPARYVVVVETGDQWMQHRSCVARFVT